MSSEKPIRAFSVDDHRLLQDGIAASINNQPEMQLVSHPSRGAGARGHLLENMPPNELGSVVRQVHSGKKRVPPELAAQIAEHMG
jgi:DNA-binding NarL/FixJ family response regulator